MSLKFLLKGHLLIKAHTNHTSKMAIFLFPRLYSGSTSSKQRPTSNVNPFLIYYAYGIQPAPTDHSIWSMQ